MLTFHTKKGELRTTFLGLFLALKYSLHRRVVVGKNPKGAEIEIVKDNYTIITTAFRCKATFRGQFVFVR